jgi:hypothetical protein
MDDFRSQLSAVIDDMLAAGVEPVFLVVDLEGVDHIKQLHGVESLDKFREAAIGAIVSAGHGCEAFSYGDDRVVAILAGFDRLKTFAVVEKLRRGLPFLAQSFDCVLHPQFDILEYVPETGVAGLVGQLVRRPEHRSNAA